MEENEIIIGAKNPSVYLRVIRGKLSQNKEIVIKTRGKLISTACFIVSILSEEKFVKIKNVKILGSKFIGEDKKERLVPEIEINLMKENIK